ncbi:MAG: hypothetical protein BGO21_07285 [Dyadobacter sp. 50-39]|nr:MAG: hypothetical protein BGO21_07285 [Dyadobacter sp. 50-39]
MTNYNFDLFLPPKISIYQLSRLPGGGQTNLANSWNTGIGTSGGGTAAQTVPPITMSYNSSTDVYTASAPSGYVDYKWVVGNGELDRGVGSGSSASSMALAGAGVRCWVKNSTGNWKLTPLVYAQTCRSGARLGAGDGSHSDTPGNEELINLTVSPNPGADQVNIRFNLLNSAQVSLNIINDNGQILRKVVNNQHGKGSFNYLVNVSDLPDGIYLCQLKANDISLVKKLLVKK